MIVGNEMDEYYGCSLSLHRAFWNGEHMTRPLLAVNLGMYAHDHCPNTMSAISPGRLSPEDIPVESFLADCDRQHDILQRVDDDYPFVASPFVYVPWVEAIMGCGVEASLSGIWAERCLYDSAAWQLQRPGRENQWRSKLREMMIALVRHANGRYPVSTTMMRGPADVFAAMRGASDMAMDFLDRPEAVRAALEMIADVWIEVAKEQSALIPESSSGYMDGDRGLRFWSPERATWLQEDAMAFLSPSIYRECVLPVDRRTAHEAGSAAFHMHDTATWAIDDLLTVHDLRVIELNWEAANSDTEMVLAGWEKIARNRPTVIWRLYGEDFWSWMDIVCDRLPANNLSFQITAETLEGCIEICEGFKARFGD